MQENVDQAHYISGMRQRMFNQAALIERLYTAINLMAEESKKKHVDTKKIDSLQRSAIQLSDGHMLPPL
ncbi:hypothetical protein [Bacillus sp. JCM 19041]|uniref:hypothetical protein n=1 Tax=Bacillus sp. JCM 19041 TaxID=1460637 RepID=UPI0006D036B3